jgi:LDH2 family malate/lactate/ureidoglycolate dehydrogenase
MAALYALRAARAGQVGMVFTTASPAMPPHGGRAKFLGTSPLAVAAPTGDGPPFCLDMAMSVAARGKLKFAAQRGQPIPRGLALDRDGRPTADGAAAFDGTVLPFGGVKGAGLSWMMDVLAGALTGAGHAGEVANPFTGLDRPQNAGNLMLAIRADLFMPLAAFVGGMNRLAARAKAVPLADGFDEILSPGEPEARREAANRAAGVPLTPDVIADLRAAGARAGVDWPFG